MKGLALKVVPAPDLGTVRQIVSLLDRGAAAIGHAAMSEHKRFELLEVSEDQHAHDPAHRFVGILASIEGRPGLAGYAQIVGSSMLDVYAVEMVVDPTIEDRSSLAGVLLGASLEQVGAIGGGTVRFWAAKATDVDDGVAAAHGFQVERDLIQMRCPLPLSNEKGGPPSARAIHTRSFRPGIDEEAWLATNNRAFASHPEQGHWDRATLLEREREPWFDPEGLLLLEDEGRLAGSCWTKVHRTTDPPMGEIYVIGVDPDFHGRGWGRALTHAGLRWLSKQGLTVGMLYVDADNVAAASMYRSMGFVEDHVDRAYVASV